MAYSETLNLARQLNAIETIYVSQTTNTKPVSQHFDYLLVLDFEATCWAYPENKNRSPEIIEFPVVLYDVKEGKILEEFQQYVTPVEFTTLSDFCINLTGIQQYLVDQGVPLGTCLMLFTKWINMQQKKYNMCFPCGMMLPGKKKCIFVTWSDWDLQTCLSKECKRKNIYKQDIFSKWIDLRALYMEHYCRRPKNFAGALSEVGLEFVGREHCGLDDARNTAYLAKKMIDDGMLLRVTKELNGKKK